MYITPNNNNNNNNNNNSNKETDNPQKNMLKKAKGGWSFGWK